MLIFNSWKAAFIDLLDPIPDVMMIPCKNVGAPTKISILAENAGRVNFAQLDGNFVGLTDSPTFAGAKMKNWEITSLPLDSTLLGLSLKPRLGQI